MQILSPKPDPLATLAALSSSLHLGYRVRVWMPGKIFFHGYIYIDGVVMSLIPVLYDGREWVVVVENTDGERVLHIVDVTTYPKAEILY